MLAQNYPQILWSIFNEHASNGLELPTDQGYKLPTHPMDHF